MSSEFSPINRIGHFYDASVEEPQAIWQDFATSGIDFSVDIDADTEEETDDLQLGDDSIPWERLLTVTVQEALDHNAVSVEFSPRRDDVVVHYTFDGGQDEAGTLPCGAYESFVRYLQRVADGDRLEITVAGRCIRLKIEFSQVEYGTRTALRLPEEKVDEMGPPAV